MIQTTTKHEKTMIRQAYTYTHITHTKGNCGSEWPLGVARGHGVVGWKHAPEHKSQSFAGHIREKPFCLQGETQIRHFLIGFALKESLVSFTTFSFITSQAFPCSM